MGAAVALGHPRIRVPEPEIERLVLPVFDSVRIENDAVRDWFRSVLASQAKDEQAESPAKRGEHPRQHALLIVPQDRPLNMRLDDEVDQETFTRKDTEFRDRLASIKLQVDAVDRSHDENTELAAKWSNSRKPCEINGYGGSLHEVSNPRNCLF